MLDAFHDLIVWDQMANQRILQPWIDANKAAELERIEEETGGWEDGTATFSAVSHENKQTNADGHNLKVTINGRQK